MEPVPVSDDTASAERLSAGNGEPCSVVSAAERLVTSPLESGWESPDSKFKKEQIPDGDHLYIRIPRISWPPEAEGAKAVAFKIQGDDGWSTDWSGHSTPENTRARAGDNAPNVGICSLNVGKVRGIITETGAEPDCKVKHDPLPSKKFPTDEDNQSHSLVIPRNPKRKDGRISFRTNLKMELLLILQDELPPDPLNDK